MAGWLTIISMLLQLAVFISRRADRKDIEESLTNAIDLAQGKRIAAAKAASDDVMSGRVPVDPKDPNRRD